ncbi:MAG TPA: hypothetical protein VJB69_00800 [Candidatus Paceibacterota bacterium]
MTKIISKTHHQREWQTVFLLGLIALSIVSYIFLVNRVVFHAVNKRDVSREIAILQSEVTNLEARAFTLSSNVTLDLAYALGFVDSGIGSSYTIASETTGLLVSSQDYDGR